MVVTVGSDFQLTVGGPQKEAMRVVATFVAGEKLTLERANAQGAFPEMYKIKEYPNVGNVSRRILLGFVRGL
jgi:hypothetical protein